MTPRALLDFLRTHRLAVQLSWTGLVYIRVRPTWLRYSDYNSDPPVIVEFGAGQLER